MSKLGWIVVAVLIAAGGAYVWQTTRPTPGPAAHSMTPPDTSDIEKGAAIVEVRLPAELSPQGEMGARAFKAKCATCHGANAAGHEGKGPPLVHRIYEPGHHSDMAFVLAAKNGVRSHHWRFGNMPPVEGVTDADVKAIATYVRELQKENGIF
ncbi:Cytochrome c553 [Roseovarius lutimaris]|uniref:Cytochrome c553 n=1 Tax=Roseovarius lutimaris TaxID=1005928 RepID=A0A1I5F2Z0_9RHOB|nr:cytochrome c [Roseovarius lutimaris]SFO18158.1 Cytochrome c553 [Roseovarius lutimaris]